MDDRKFSLPEIIILLFIAVTNDVLVVLADLSLAIPVVGEVVGGTIEIANFVIWGIIILWFVLKLRSFGAIGVIQTAGGAAEFIGVPSRTITAAIGIFLANHPKAASVASIASGKITNPK